MLAGILLQAWAFSWPPAAWVPAFLVGAVVGGTNISFAERKRHGEQLRLAHEALEEMARIAERERIGRDLHDLLGHTLSVIVLKSELASKLAARDPKRALEEIRDVERISGTRWRRFARPFAGTAPKASTTRSPTPSACWSPPASGRC